MELCISMIETQCKTNLHDDLSWVFKPSEEKERWGTLQCLDRLAMPATSDKALIKDDIPKNGFPGHPAPCGVMQQENYST